MGVVKNFIDKNYLHFNAATLKSAAQGYAKFIDNGGKMLVSIAGAMSTAELGITLAEMIRKNKVHAISTTGANLEEDIFNLVAHDKYERIPNWRALSVQDEVKLLKRHMNRVTDTCIPEEEAMRFIEGNLIRLWQLAEKEGKRYFPHEFMFQLIKSGVLKKHYKIDPKHSWVIAAYEKKIPIVAPGWEDSTLGNMFVSNVIKGKVKNISTVKSGLEAMQGFIKWYLDSSAKKPIGFFQIGGGIAGDFPICVVPLITQDLQIKTRVWQYFCQISDSTTSYGSYSGAVPNEKITWGKLNPSAPSYIIESDATIVAPLIFSYVLNK